MYINTGLWKNSHKPWKHAPLGGGLREGYSGKLRTWKGRQDESRAREGERAILNVDNNIGEKPQNAVWLCHGHASEGKTVRAGTPPPALPSEVWALWGSTTRWKVSGAGDRVKAELKNLQLPRNRQEDVTGDVSPTLAWGQQSLSRDGYK